VLAAVISRWTKRTGNESVVLAESHFSQRTLRHPLIQNGFRPSVIILTPATVELLDKHRKDASSLRRLEDDRGGCREVCNDAVLQVQGTFRVGRQIGEPVTRLRRGIPLR
jgi:hypothetical protein